MDSKARFQSPSGEITHSVETGSAPTGRRRVLSEGEGLHGAARVQAMSAVAIAVVLALLDYAVANVALPSIATDIHASPASAIWIVNSYQLASVVSLLPIAALGSRFGFGLICQSGLALFVLASLLCGISHTLLELSISRALQGIGGGCIMSVSIALVRFIYPDAIIGRGIALNGVMVAVGVALGPTVASLVLSVASWPWLFLLNVPVGGAALVLALVSLPHTPRQPTPFDTISALLNVAAFGAIIMAGDGVAHHAPAWTVAMMVAAGILAGWLLVRRQKGRDQPMFPIDMLRSRSFSTGVIIAFCAFTASNLFIVSMPFTLQNVFMLPVLKVGLLMTPWSVGIVTVAPLMSRLSDRVSATILSTIGLVVTALGFALLYFMPAHPAPLDIAWRVGLAGMGFGVFQPPNNRIIMVSAPAGRSGGASGMVQVARQCGQTVGAMLVAMVLGLVSFRPSIWCLAMASVVALVGAAVSFSRVLNRAS